MVAMSDFSTFSQITYVTVSMSFLFVFFFSFSLTGHEKGPLRPIAALAGWRETYGNAVVVLLTDALSLGLALLEGVLVLELGSHDEGCWT